MGLENYQRFSQAHQQMQQGNIAAAIELCQKILESTPEDADANNLLGIMASNQGEINQAKQFFETGLRKHPKHIYLLNSFGSVLMQLGEFELAEQQFQAAISEKENFVNALYNLSRLKTILNQYLEAELLLKKVIQIEPLNAAALANLSAIEEKQNNLTLATQYAEKALANDGSNFIARLTLSNVHFRNENYSAAIQELIPTLKQGQNLTPVNYSLAVGGIAQAYDKMKQFPEALDHYKKSNQALKYIYQQQFENADSVYAPKSVLQANQIISNFSFSDWKKPTIQSQRSDYPSPIFLIGFPRSGTTLLDQMLAAHSQIITLEEKETLIDIYQKFPINSETISQLNGISEHDLTIYKERYWDRVAENSDYVGEGVLVDKLPLNSIMLIYIHRLFPDAKIIFSVRDPRDVAISCFQQRFGINQAMYQFLEIETTVAYYDAVMHLSQSSLRQFSQDVFRVKYEDLVLDYQGVLKSLFDFLGLEWEQDIENYREQASSKMIDTPSNKQVVKPLYTDAISKWKNYAPYLKKSLSSLDKWVSFWGYK